MYTDDLLLLSFSICDMQNMINICKVEFDLLNMFVNMKKSSCIRVGSRFDVTSTDLYLNNVPIKWCTEIRYLGIGIKAASVFKCDLRNAKIKFFHSLNGILGKLGTTPKIGLTLSLVETFANQFCFMD